MFYKNNQSSERLSKIGKNIYLFIILFCFTGGEGLCIKLITTRRQTESCLHIKYEAESGRILLILESLSTYINYLLHNMITSEGQ